MSLYSSLTLQKKLNWIQSAGINNKKYNPWVGAQLLGVRDQYLIFHPLILLWDLKRIQLFLNRIQSYTNYSLLLVDSRPAIQKAIENYLQLRNVPASQCHVLHFNFPGTLTNQYYMGVQSTTTSIITSRQVIVFFDYFLNKQFYLESLKIPSIRLSLYSLQNLPINMQYGLPAKTGLLLAIRLLLKLLLKPVFNVQLHADQYAGLINNFQKSIPFVENKSNLHYPVTSLEFTSRFTKRTCRGPVTTIKSVISWKHTNENKFIKKFISHIKLFSRKKLQKRKKRLFRKYKRFYMKKIASKIVKVSTSQVVTSLQSKLLAHLFSRTQKPLTKHSLGCFFASHIFCAKHAKLLIRSKKLRILKVTTRKNTTQKASKLKIKTKRASFRKIKATKIQLTAQPKVLTISSLNLFYLVNNSPALKQSKKNLIAKFNRTCNIKTQKEWQEIKQKNKIKMDQKKAALRNKQTKKIRQQSISDKKTKNKIQANRPHSTKKSFVTADQTSGFRDHLNIKPTRRSFSSKCTLLTTTKKRSKARGIINWTEALFGLKWYAHQKKSLRLVLPTQRSIIAWQRYFGYPRVKVDSALLGKAHRKNVLRIKHYFYPVAVKNVYVPQGSLVRQHLDFDRMLCSISGMRRWNRKSKLKLRILRFRQWYRVMTRLARKRDRRWRQRKWKRAALRQFTKFYQCVYTSTSRYAGFTYWQKWRLPRNRRRFNWRKWRSRYFRRYARKEHARLHSLQKPLLLFYKRFPKSLKQHSYSFRNVSIKRNNILPRIALAFGTLCTLRKLNRYGRQQRVDGRLTKRFTKKRFVLRQKLWKNLLRKLPRFLAHRRNVKARLNILKKRVPFIKSCLLLSAITTPCYSSRNVTKKNYTNQLWFRNYRNTKLNSSSNQKAVSNSFRQLVGQKKLFIGRNLMLKSYWASNLTLKSLLKYKYSSLWNWRLFKERQRTTEEFKRYVQNFQHTSIKLHKHKILSITTAKKLRQNKTKKLLRHYKTMAGQLALGNILLPFFQSKPIQISKINFLKFNGKLRQNRTILLGFNKKSGLSHSFLQCYSNRRFWANDNFGPSPLIFWISPKARRKKTPKQWSLNSSFLNFRLDINLPNFSCLSVPKQDKSVSGFNLRSPEHTSKLRIKEINRSNSFKTTFKFIVSSRESTSHKQDRWLWYFLKKQYPSQSILWQQNLNYTRRLRSLTRLNSARKLFYTHYQKPKSVANYIAYILRCNRRRRRRLRERTFRGPTRYRRKYRTQYMYSNLIRLNSHRSRYGKPDTRNQVNHYFIRKLVLRRFLRLIYGPKLTNKYFKHFSTLLFIKKFKFWTLYTFFYLRLDFVAILLKFAMNLTWSRRLIQNGLILVNDNVEKASYSIFLGDIIRLERLYQCSSNQVGQSLDWIRNLAAVAPPRIASSLKYQTRLRIPAFFEYSSRIKAGTMFRLPWYYEVRGKLVNKENFLLLARGPHSI